MANDKDINVLYRVTGHQCVSQNARIRKLCGERTTLHGCVNK